MAERQRVCCAVFISTVALVGLTMLFAEGNLLFNNASLSERIQHYETLRKSLVERELYQQFGGQLKLSSNELKANERIMATKRSEYNEGIHNASQFKPAHHFFKVYKQITQSPLFNLLQTMPKGGVLHAHDTALCSTDFLIELTYRDHLWICVNGSDNFERLRFLRQQPDKLKAPDQCEWTLLKLLRAAKGASEIDRRLRERLTLYPQEHFADGHAAWQSFRGIFRFTYGLLTFEPIWADYHYNALEELYADGVQYLEMRSTLPTLYNLDGDNFTIMDTMRILQEVSAKFVTVHPDFIGSKVIYAPTRNANDSVLEVYLKNALKLKENFPDYFAGFDLVSHEEAGRPLKDFAHKLIAVQHKLNFYFHAGETNWYGTATDENLYDALLLGSKRIGHGYALPKHPEVLRYLRLENIAVEVSPISNQVLQHLVDFRNHPAAYLFANGYPVVISCDDPSFWKATPLTHDFYIAFLGIASKSANLRMLKQLALNSLQYSAMNNTRKEQAIDMWYQKWNAWIELIGLDFLF